VCNTKSMWQQCDHDCTDDAACQFYVDKDWEQVKGQISRAICAVLN
jgi:hypothetical protein